MLRYRGRAGVLLAAVVMIVCGLAPAARTIPVALAATPADAAAGASTVRALGPGSRIPWQGQD